MEEEREVRINRVRLAQIQTSGADQIAVACPFSMILLEDAGGAAGAEDLVIRDIAKIVADGLVAG
jgi:Fe-S oxidoreductase